MILTDVSTINTQRVIDGLRIVTRVEKGTENDIKTVTRTVLP